MISFILKTDDVPHQWNIPKVQRFNFRHVTTFTQAWNSRFWPRKILTLIVKMTNKWGQLVAYEALCWGSHSAPTCNH